MRQFEKQLISYAVFCSSNLLLTGNMKYIYFYSVCFLGFSTTVYGAGSVNPACLEKEKALALLETVDNFLTKAKFSFPTCVDSWITEDECGGKQSLAYIEISKTLIADVRNNFPTCIKPIDKDDKDVKDGNYDCSDILASGRNKSGIYTIWLGETQAARKQRDAYCDMETEEGGWTLIQRRGKVPAQQDFYLGWESYKNGFGSISEEFWFGNENIRVLCHKGCKIRFDLVDDKGEKGFAVYQSFNLSRDNYRISISNYSGNIGDGMQHHNNNVFSTKDKGLTARAEVHKSGWWFFSSDYYVNLNGLYQPGKYNPESVLWWLWRNKLNLDSVEIKVKRN